MDKKTCNDCKYFRHHYSFDQQRIFRVYCGHCTCPKAKSRKPDAKICERYAPTDPDESSFANKEYLSKKLVEYMIGLELLPEIIDACEKKSLEG